MLKKNEYFMSLMVLCTHDQSKHFITKIKNINWCDTSKYFNFFWQNF